MADDKPTIYLLHGDDAFAIRKFIASMKVKLGDPAMADLNTIVLDGRQAGVDEIRAAAYSMPFLADRRLVVLSHPLARFPTRGMREEGSEEAASGGQLSEAQRAGREKFLALLDGVPTTTALVLVIEDSRFRRRGEWHWEALTPNHWLRRWAAAQPEKRVWIQECVQPTVEEMPGWIRKQAESQQGRFSPQAARALAEYVGADTQVAAQEITKLLTYVDYKRPVEEDDVTLLTTRTNQASIFTLVDAMGDREGRLAMHTLHQLMEESDPSELFGMILRQFRLLLQVREVLDEGGGIETIGREVKEREDRPINPYVAQKLAGQAQKFTMGGLREIYNHLLEIDMAIKTSQTTPEVAFDTLIAELAN